MKRFGIFHNRPDVSLVKLNIEGYVGLFHDNCLSGVRLAEDFVEIVAYSGHTDSAVEFLKLLPSEVTPLVMELLCKLREAEYHRILTPRIGCELTESELVENAERLRSRYEALDKAIGPTA